MALLATQQLPIAGVEDQFPRAYTLARLGSDVVGMAGLEIYGETGLLRSVAVQPGSRGQGLGRQRRANSGARSARRVAGVCVRVSGVGAVLGVALALSVGQLAQ